MTLASKTTRRSAIALAFVACLACAPPGDGVVLTIAHVNDSHAHLDSTGVKDAELRGRFGGLTRAASILHRIRAEERNLLLLHAGDLLQGDLFFNAYRGVPELQALRSLGFHAVAVGNHELGYGADFLAASLADAWADGDALPLLSANLDATDAPSLSPWVQPRMVKRVGPVTVGLFGMTVPDDRSTFPEPARLLGAGAPEVLARIAAEQVAALRADGAQVVVCLSHLGLAADQALASSVDGIDVVVGGHDHALLFQPLEVLAPAGGRTLVVQAGEFYGHVGRLRLSLRGRSVHLDRYDLIAVTDAERRDPAILDQVAQLEAGIVDRFGDVFRDVVGSSVNAVSARWDAGGSVRDVAAALLVADALRARTGTDVAMTTAGLVSEGLPSGAITAADVFRMVSYGLDPETGLGFRIATFRISGAELARAIESALAIGGADATPQVSGMRYAFDATRGPGDRLVLDQLSVGDAPIDPAARYSITVNTGLLAAMAPLQLEIEEVAVRPELEFDVVRDHLRTLPSIDVFVDGRVVDVSAVPRPLRDGTAASMREAASAR